jgi:GNAT superfamily N-acetyltransferase
MSVAVEEIDAATAPDDVLRAIHAVETACELDLGERASRTAADALAYFRHPPGGEVRRRWVSHTEGEVVGTAGLFVHGPSFVYAQLYVRPDARRRGHGAALLDALRRTAAAEGITSLFARHQTPGGAAFAQHAGAVDGIRDVRSELLLAEARLDPPPLPEGVELRSWVGAAPDELIESYALAHDAMNDSPFPDGQVDRPWTIERMRDVEEAVARRGREHRATVAVADGAVVAFTEMRVSAPPSPHASTEDTATLAPWRGRGLASAVKCEALRRLRQERPDVEHVGTLNAEENVPMRAVNTRIGFVPVATLTTTVLTL